MCGKKREEERELEAGSAPESKPEPKPEPEPQPEPKLEPEAWQAPIAELQAELAEVKGFLRDMVKGAKKSSLLSTVFQGFSDLLPEWLREPPTNRP